MRKKSSGFSLIEVLIASLVLSVGMAGVLAFFPLGIKRVQAMMLEKQSVIIANNYMVALRDFVQNRDRNQLGSGFDDLTDGTSISLEYLLRSQRVYEALANNRVPADIALGRVIIRDAVVLGVDIASPKLPLSFGSDPVAYEYENSDGTCWVRILFKTLAYGDHDRMDLNWTDGINQARYVPFAKVFRITVGRRGSDEQHDFWTIIGDYQLAGHLGYIYPANPSNAAGKNLTIPPEGATPTPTPTP